MSDRSQRDETPDRADSFIDSLVESLGSRALCHVENQAFYESLLTRHSSSLRLRRNVAPESIPFSLRPVPWYPLGFDSTDPDIRPSRCINYAAGDFFLQDSGSMLALAACDADEPPQVNRLICDLCAAPGGKASALLESVGDGFLLANEPIKSRLAPLAYNLARTGCDRYCISSLDPEVLADRMRGVFDLVLADVPCSGQALLGKGKQSLAAVSKTQVEHSASRARRILAAAIDLVRPGGQLVLSTCTFAEAENESQVHWLLEKDGVSPFHHSRLADYCSDETKCCYRLWPHRHGCAGSFAASLVCDRDNQVKERRTKKGRQRKDSMRLPDELKTWCSRDPLRYKVSGAVIWAWPDDVPDWVDSISVGGPELAYRTGQTWKPSHDLALRRDHLSDSVASIEVDEETAFSFLSGQPIPCLKPGWCIVRHHSRPLGWVKASQGIGKNHLPSAARMIRAS
ncbi:MAG: hypothetical protein KDB00_17025 [Planctomycetales bacterium]|nr:hypothetical protein [Planctomycetales bacterium]